jgi:hypothetical protein
VLVTIWKCLDLSAIGPRDLRTPTPRLGFEWLDQNLCIRAFDYWSAGRKLLNMFRQNRSIAPSLLARLGAAKGDLLFNHCQSTSATRSIA